ncbi:glycosyltransferase family 90 protein [Plenodomus tracheiphilus IPT5]|uniref:Glycosyltransferase family 90 protein n=1 Tax=Plenodomus tracheiphilus IPT5 TaxID=1408161 RepID=A0A6A7AVI6_9PLEO|nr:glycosyltransferase family 90 protein [Plenodomus tracheiphilus IPT5]
MLSPENLEATQSWTTTWVTAAAILSAQLYPIHSTASLAVYSELLCWTLLTIIFTLVPRYHVKTWEGCNNRFNAFPPALLWVAAASISVAALASSAGDATWVTPIVPSILLALRRNYLLPRLRKSQPEYFQSTWLSLGLGLVSAVFLAPNYQMDKLAVSGLVLLALTGLYGSLIIMCEPRSELQDGFKGSNLGSSMRAIAVRALPLLLAVAVLLTTIWRPSQFLNVLTCLCAGFLKATHWLLVLWVTLSQLAVALLSLHQIVLFLPKTTIGRYSLMVLAVWPTFSLIRYTSLSGMVPFISEDVWDQKLYNPQPRPTPHHPIEELVAKAHESFVALVERQSRTLEAAETEYLRRYGRSPPPGFEKWFEYAQSKQSILIDDFDMIEDDLKPFWRIPVERLHESVDYVTSFDHLALRKCGFVDGVFQGQGDAWIVNDVGQLLQEVSKNLPDVSFAFDVVDEPRVVVTQQMLDDGGVAKPEFQDVSHTPIWARTVSPCQGRISKISQPKIHDYGLSFVQDWYYAKDVCQHPEFEDMHGFFKSPATALLTDAPIPVLSQAAPTSFGDIMYPSPWYTEKLDQGDYKDAEDPPWDKKADTLYWAGSTTGSYSTNGGWKYSHRQRLIKMVKDLPRTQHKYMTQLKPGLWATYQAVEDHSDLFDVKLTAIIQCDELDCREQEDYFKPSDKEERSQQFASRFVFDADGNSFSGRYYTLLQSRSVVLKQTVLREWHDERLIPWVHFVPVSLSMEELPEIMRYMTSDETGRRIAKEIADAGREWHAKVLRREDFTIYLYRLMLELARVMDPGRQE